MRKIIFTILLFSISFCLSAESIERPDDLQELLDNAIDKEKLAVWKKWYQQLRVDYYDYWETNLSSACSDAKKYLSDEEAFDWCFQVHLTLQKQYLRSGQRLRSERILEKAFTLLNESDLSATQSSKNLKAWYNAKGVYALNKTLSADSAFVFFDKALKINLGNINIEEDTSSYSVFVNMAKMFEAEKEYLTADGYLQKAIALAKIMDLNPAQTNDLELLKYKLNHHTKKTNVNEEDYKTLLNQSAALDSFLILNIHIDYANFLFQNNQAKRAFDYLNDLKETVYDFDFYEIYVNYHELGIEIAHSLGNKEATFNHYKDGRDRFYDEFKSEINEQRLEQKRELDFSTKKRELLNLQQENQTKKSNYIRWFSILIIGSTFILSLLYFFNQKNKNKSQQLQLQKQREDTIATERNRLFSSISSEIKQPLVQMMSILGTTGHKVNDTQASSDIALAERNGIRLMELFDQIVDWNNLESRLLKANPQEVDLAEKLLYTANRMELFAKEKGIPFLTDINVKEGSYSLDYEKVNRILSNLIGNAIKFSEQGQEVKFSVQENESADRMTIDIIDNGPGISEEELQNLFKQHFQGEAGLRKGGTGIGLATVKELVELLKGNITCQSKLGTGSTFKVEIPIEKIQEDLNVPAMNLDDKPIVLLVEDDLELLQFVKSNLNKKYTVLTASSAQAGIETAIDQVPTLIISDWNLQDNTGGWLSKQVKSNPITTHIPIMILTGFSNETHRQEVFESGAIARMEKPFQLSALEAQIQNILAQIKYLEINWRAKSDLNPEQIEAKAPSFIDDFSKIIQDNLEDEYFSVEKMAELLLMSRVQLFRKLKNTTGKSPSVHLSEARLIKSRELLKDSAKTISEIAYQVGFSDPNYFSKAYKKQFGNKPSEDRKA